MATLTKFGDGTKYPPLHLTSLSCHSKNKQVGDVGGHVLVVEDDRDQALLVVRDLNKLGFHTTVVHDSEQAEKALTDHAIDVLLADINLEGRNDGIQLVKFAKRSSPNTALLLMTAYADVKVAVEALRAGAHDLILKPMAREDLLQRVKHGVEYARLRRRVDTLPSSPLHEDSMVGNSPGFNRVRQLIKRVSQVDMSVLLVGESGTGKELVARAIHEASPRRDKPFVPTNCAAMPLNLLESELFGHQKGAFSGADQDHEGLFRYADGGTLFLDEIGDMPLEMQAKLLRVLQEGVVRPVGGKEEVPFDTRIISATHKDLKEEVSRGNFREDLFYRIHVLQVRLPPLRARGDDVLLLAQRFLSLAAAKTNRDISGFSPDAASALLTYSWPGNVRELEHVVQRASILTDSSEVNLEDLPDHVRQIPRCQTAFASETLLTLKEAEDKHVRDVLLACKGNKSRAAQVLGINRRSLYRRLDRMQASSSTSTDHREVSY